MKRFFKPIHSPLENHYRFNIVLFCLLACAVVLLCTYLFVVSAGRPYMGIDLVFKDHVWEVTAVDINGMASRNGVALGDRPVEINGQPAEVFLQRYEKVGTVYGMLIKELTVLGEQGHSKSVILNDFFSFQPALIVQIPMFVVCLIFWIIGFYVFFKRPRNRSALLLCIISLFMGTLFCGGISGEVSISAGAILSIISSVIGPWLLLHFFLVLPEERTQVRKSPLIYLIYLPPLITLILFPLFGWADGQPLPEFRTIRFIEVGAGLMAVAVVVVLNYLRAGSARTRQQMKIILVASLAALIPFLVLYLLPQTILKQSVIPPGYSILFLMFIPIGMGVAVVTQKLMDIDFVIRRSVIYTLISLVMAAILSAALFPVLVFRQSIAIYQEIIIVLLLGGVATALLGPSKQGIELLIDKLFYKDRYDYRQIIHSFSTSLNTLNEVSDISRLIVGTIVRTLNLAGGCLFVKSEAGLYEASAVQGIFTEADRQRKLTGLISRRSHLPHFPNSASSIYPEVAFIIPLLAGETEIGILCLSHKLSRQDFSQDDIYLLQGLVSVVSTALHSALLVRDVSLRNTFVSIASHELRTPLTSILGYAELLSMRNPPEESRQKWLAKITSNGQKITSMVDDLLNVSRIQSGKVSLKMEGVNLEEFLKERLSVVQESDGIHTFKLNIEPGLPEAFIDRDKFGQVVSNLLSNAVKFSPNGGCINLSARNDSRQNRIVVSVTDEGMGIGPADRESLFTTFHRIQRPETQGIRGSGLGLYIVKEWTLAMGGEVWLESEMNKGSTFFVAVPAVNGKSQS